MDSPTASRGVQIIKVCGITSVADAQACLEAGADLLGCIFHPTSPRCVDPATAAAIAATATAAGKQAAGVFVRQTVDEVRDIMQRAGLSLAQLHGKQDRAFCEAIGPERVIKVFWPEAHAEGATLGAEMDAFCGAAKYFLLDAGMTGGGHGRPMETTSLAAKLAHMRPSPTPRPWLLAGGLGPQTLQGVLTPLLALPSLAGLAGIDINSGVEIAPGRKDAAAVRATVSLFTTTMNERRYA